MGAEDLYPFLTPPKVVDKLGFIHALVESSSAAGRGSVRCLPVSGSAAL
jgi:hypothetical protein